MFAKGNVEHAHQLGCCALTVIRGVDAAPAVPAQSDSLRALMSYVLFAK
jgi:hypothetical protein